MGKYDMNGEPIQNDELPEEKAPLPLAQLPILEVQACAEHVEMGPAVVTYCSAAHPSFVAMPAEGQNCSFCELRRTSFHMISSSQRTVDGDLRSPGNLRFDGDIHVRGSVEVRELSSLGSVTVDGDLTAMLMPVALGSVSIRGDVTIIKEV
jgi:hypothetical protein